MPRFTLQGSSAAADIPAVEHETPIAGRAVSVRATSLHTSPRALIEDFDRNDAAIARLDAARRRHRERFAASIAATDASAAPIAGRPGTGGIRRRGSTRAAMLPAIIGFAVLALGIILTARRGERTWTESEVVQEIRRIALEGGRAESLRAGRLGPLRLSARTVDPATGEFVGFRIETDQIMVAAARAAIVVDAEQDTFAFDLQEVVVTRIPDEVTEPGDAAPDAQSLIHTADRHRFGPAAFGSDIKPDGTPRTGGGGLAGRRTGGGLGPRGAAAAEDSAGDWLRDAGGN